jgi:hypothetical protein
MMMGAVPELQQLWNNPTAAGPRTAAGNRGDCCQNWTACSSSAIAGTLPRLLLDAENN